MGRNEEEKPKPRRVCNRLSVNLTRREGENLLFNQCSKFAIGDQD